MPGCVALHGAAAPCVSIAACPTETKHVCRALTVISGYRFFLFFLFLFVVAVVFLVVFLFLFFSLPLLSKGTKKKKKGLDSVTLAAGWPDRRV